ncbi:MAG: hypothetical protein A4E65_03767 [Syntrophorhabdus sp. PtaU1.Bin153]|nr:MAG: hypothetical protein A4E65_03767 [Syntrophorhabdus sp. PtaU1.Bin153]
MSENFFKEKKEWSRYKDFILAYYLYYLHLALNSRTVQTDQQHYGRQTCVMSVLALLLFAPQNYEIYQWICARRRRFTTNEHGHNSSQGETMKYDEIGEWSEIKLDILKEYAGAYTAILSKKSWCKGYIYIDAFAGPGQHIRKTTGEFVTGSPLNALSVRPSFTEYHYIDLDGEKVEELRKIADNRAGVHVYHGDCNEKLTQDILPRLTYDTYKRALCFLDPYGLHLEWKTVKLAGSLKTVDIFLNFPIMDINRNVLFADLGKAKREDVERMNAFWGDDGWQQILYREQSGLFGGTHLVKVEGFERLALEYRKRLKTIAGFKFVPEPVLMRNAKNGPLYYLFFASPQRVAEKIISDIFKKYRKRL